MLVEPAGVHLSGMNSLSAASTWSALTAPR
jgi:hypothetical protein